MMSKKVCTARSRISPSECNMASMVLRGEDLPFRERQGNIQHVEKSTAPRSGGYRSDQSRDREGTVRERRGNSRTRFDAEARSHGAKRGEDKEECALRVCPSDPE